MKLEAFRALVRRFERLADKAERWWRTEGEAETERGAIGQTRAEADAAKVSLDVAEATGVVPSDVALFVEERFAHWHAYWKARGVFRVSMWPLWGGLGILVGVLLTKRGRKALL